MREPYALKGARTVPGRGCGSNPAPLFDGLEEIIAMEVVVNDTGTLSATFDLAEVGAGAWDVVLRNADGKATLLPGTFTIRVKGNLNNNGRVDIGDAAKIAHFIVGRISEL